MAKIDFDLLKDRMINQQLQRRGISGKKILDVFRQVERHRFVPEALREFAYDDCPLEIGYGQTISQPYMVALMIECLKLEGGEKVLEIGTGSGYQAAILSRLSRVVYSMERLEALAKKSAEALSELGYSNVNIRQGDGTQGWPEEAPFDRIMIAAATPQVPQPLIEQLGPGGRLVAPVGDRLSQVLTILDKYWDGLKVQEAGACVFVPLIGKYGYPH